MTEKEIEEMYTYLNKIEYLSTLEFSEEEKLLFNYIRKAVVKSYHPDVYKGDSSLLNKLIQLLNKLGNIVKQ